jgi:hypothetical protein
MFGFTKPNVEGDHTPWCWVGVLWVCLLIPGCAAPDLRGESLPHNDLADAARRSRPASPNDKAWGASNKAREIEKDFGYQ